MNTEERSQLQQALISRRGDIADSWYKAITRTSFVPNSEAEVGQHLVELTEEAIALLLTEPFDHGQAQAIGASLVGLHYIEPEVLGRTQEVLAQQFAGSLRADQVAALQPRLVALLGGVATGFFQQAREAILSEQERVRGALICELQHMEEETIRLSSAVKTSVDGIVIMDVERKITYVNEAALKMYDTDDKEDMIGQDILDLVAPEHREMGLAGIGLVLEKGYYQSGDYEVITKGSRRIPVELSAAVMKDADGKPIGVVIIARDITERKRVEEALQERERRLRTVVTGAPIILFAVDREGVITASEGQGLRALGMKSGENVGRLVSDVYRDMPQIGENIRRALVGEEFTSIVELPGVTFETRYSPLRGENGEIIGVIGVGTDITERRRAEDQLLAYQERLQSLASQLSLAEERERRRIATELHDRIGQTLAACKIKLGVLRASASSAGLAEPLNEIHELVEEIIQATRSLTFEVSSPILYELGLEAAVEWLVEQIQQQYGLLSYFEDDRQPKPLDDDVSVLLFQAVRELLANVAKHAQAHNVKVSLRRDDSSIKITVEDDGNGFDASDVVCQWARTEGFGLFSIRERLDHLGGHLEVHSEPGHGTWATLAAPLKRDGTITREE